MNMAQKTKVQTKIDVHLGEILLKRLGRKQTNGEETLLRKSKVL